ncbi:unnamed protein product [Amoebophrya sp. A25]|nr:unnamed protein product [Amoebophrya sp. A25]|eukprot:GSA25T00015596001.1
MQRHNNNYNLHKGHRDDAGAPHEAANPHSNNGGRGGRIMTGHVKSRAPHTSIRPQQGGGLHVTTKGASAKDIAGKSFGKGERHPGPIFHQRGRQPQGYQQAVNDPLPRPPSNTIGDHDQHHSRKDLAARYQNAGKSGESPGYDFNTRTTSGRNVPPPVGDQLFSNNDHSPAHHGARGGYNGFGGEEQEQHPQHGRNIAASSAGLIGGRPLASGRNDTGGQQRWSSGHHVDNHQKEACHTCEQGGGARLTGFAAAPTQRFITDERAPSQELLSSFNSVVRNQIAPGDPGHEQSKAELYQALRSVREEDLSILFRSLVDLTLDQGGILPHQGCRAMSELLNNLGVSSTTATSAPSGHQQANNLSPNAAGHSSRYNNQGNTSANTINRDGAGVSMIRGAAGPSVSSRKRCPPSRAPPRAGQQDTPPQACDSSPTSSQEQQRHYQGGESRYQDYHELHQQGQGDRHDPRGPVRSNGSNLQSAHRGVGHTEGRSNYRSNNYGNFYDRCDEEEEFDHGEKRHRTQNNYGPRPRLPYEMNDSARREAPAVSSNITTQNRLGAGNEMMRSPLRADTNYPHAIMQGDSRGIDRGPKCSGTILASQGYPDRGGPQRVGQERFRYGGGSYNSFREQSSSPSSSYDMQQFAPGRRDLRRGDSRRRLPSNSPPSYSSIDYRENLRLMEDSYRMQPHGYNDDAARYRGGPQDPDDFGPDSLPPSSHDSYADRDSRMDRYGKGQEAMAPGRGAPPPHYAPSQRQHRLMQTGKPTGKTGDGRSYPGGVYDHKGRAGQFSQGRGGEYGSHPRNEGRFFDSGSKRTDERGATGKGAKHMSKASGSRENPVDAGVSLSGEPKQKLLSPSSDLLDCRKCSVGLRAHDVAVWGDGFPLKLQVETVTRLARRLGVDAIGFARRRNGEYRATLFQQPFSVKIVYLATSQILKRRKEKTRKRGRDQERRKDHSGPRD